MLAAERNSPMMSASAALSSMSASEAVSSISSKNKLVSPSINCFSFEVGNFGSGLDETGTTLTSYTKFSSIK